MFLLGQTWIGLAKPFSVLSQKPCVRLDCLSCFSDGFSLLEGQADSFVAIAKIVGDKFELAFHAGVILLMGGAPVADAL